MDDYCDRCGPCTRAKVIVALTSGGILTYCFHHANRYRDALEAEGACLYAVDEEILT